MNTRFSNSLLVLTAVCLIGAGSAFAGNGNGDGDGNGDRRHSSETQRQGGPANRLARMSAALDLTQEQEQQLHEFFWEQEEQRAETKARIAETFGDEVCAQRAAHRIEIEALLAEILDSEQYALHLELQEQRQARSGERRESRGNGGFDCPAEN